MVLVGVLLWVWGCGGPRNPVEEMQKSLANAPEYMILLEDMREEGRFFTDYYHKYKVIQGDRQRVTNWIEVSESVYRKYESFLGMALAAKSNKGGEQYAPPGRLPLCGQPELRALGQPGRVQFLGVLRAVRADAGSDGVGRTVDSAGRLQRLPDLPGPGAALLWAQPGVGDAGIGDQKAEPDVL